MITSGPAMTPLTALAPALPSSRPSRTRQTSRLSAAVVAQAGRRRPYSRPYSSSAGAQQQTEPPLGAASSTAWTDSSRSSIGGAAGSGSGVGAGRSGDQGREPMDVQVGNRREPAVPECVQNSLSMDPSPRPVSLQTLLFTPCLPAHLACPWP